MFLDAKLHRSDVYDAARCAERSLGREVNTVVVTRKR
jgi:hypothetical protein